MLKIGVLVKSVLDTEARVTSENGSLKIISGKFIVNPFDEFAIEEAVRIKEKFGGHITAISLNHNGREDELRYAIAMGADEAILVKTSLELFNPLKIAKAITSSISDLGFDLIISGKEAIDDNFSSVPMMIASMLNYPVISEVFEESIEGDKIRVKRLLEDSEETYLVNLPCLITVRKGINNPRYPTLPNIMKSRRASIKKIEVQVERDSISPIYENKPEKAGALIFSGTMEEIAEKVIDMMKNEAHVL